jgi:hypothetical protein
MIVVALVIAVFLLHIRSALLPIISLPLAVLLAFIPMYLLASPRPSCRSAASPSPSAPPSTPRS